MNLNTVINSYIEFNLFTKKECKKILENINNLQFTNYSIKLGKKFYENGSSMKSQDLVDNINTKWIFDRLKSKLSNEFDIKWILNPHGVFRYYTVGDYFLEHKDNVNKSGADPRYFTVTVQLSEPEEYVGGDVIVEKVNKISKNIGSATLWGSNLIHEVKNIKKGIRNSLVFFISSKHLLFNNKATNKI